MKFCVQKSCIILMKRGRGRPKKEDLVPCKLVERVDEVLAGGDDLITSPLLFQETGDSDIESLGEEFDEIASRLHSTNITVIPVPGTPEDDTDSATNEEIKMTEPKLHPEEVKSLIPVFDDTKMAIATWLQKIETLKTNLEWTPQLTLLYATSRLKGIPEMWFNDVVVTGWNDFKAKITEEFARTVNLAEVHANLRKMAKEKSETFYYYAYRVRMYGKQHGVEDPEIITYVINGLQRESIYNTLAIMKFATFPELIQVLKNYETNLSLKVYTNNQQTPPASGKSSTKWEKERADKDESASSSKMRCYNCNELGHKAPKCPKPKMRCSKCRYLGHSADQCKSSNEMKVMRQLDRRSEQSPDKDKDEASVHIGQDGIVVAQIVLGDHVSTVNALVDTGSSVSCISNKLVMGSGVQIDKSDNITVHGINGSKLEVLGKVSTQVIIESKCFVVGLWVVTEQTSSHEVIFGRDFLVSSKITNLSLDLDKNNVNSSSYDSFLMGEVISIQEELYSVFNEISLNVGDTTETRKYQSEITQSFKDNYLNRAKPAQPLVDMAIDVKFKEKNFKPYIARPRRLSNIEKIELNKIVQDLLDRKIIRESESQYTSNVVMTRKKNGKFRMCVNFKPLNKLVERNHYPMPVAETLIEELSGEEYFSCLDLKDGFFHVRILPGFEK